jgi:hypothetical protein
MAKKPLGFFRVPRAYAQMSEEERHAHAEVIGDRIRDALLAQDAPAMTPTNVKALTARAGMGRSVRSAST